MDKLEDLTTDKLSEIIKEFGKKQKIFQSEAQFQFDLAWKLREKFDCEVKLEELTAVLNEKENSKSKSKVKKIYTDIVLEKGDYRVAIELKYKTASLEKENLLNHGAVDLGRYDFLWDVNRIEFLLGKDKFIKDGEAMEGKRKQVNKGFAILLTNEKKYWNECPDNPSTNNSTIDNDFKLGDKKLVDANLDWKKENGKYPNCIVGKKKKPTWRAQPINLNQAYSYKWEEYCKLNNVGKNGAFNFVIIEVPAKK